MIKLLYKTFLLALLINCTAFVAKAQVGYDYSLYDVGASVGFNQFMGESSPNNTRPSVNLNVTFNQTPFVNYVFEVQMGTFAGGDSTQNPGLQMKSSFHAFVFRGQLQMGEIMDYSRSQLSNALKNLYVSAGVGFLYNHVTTIAKGAVNDIQGLGIYSQTHTQEPFLPLRVGYEFKMFNMYQQPSVKFDIGYEYNYIFSDNTDNYTYGNRKDAFSQFFIGVKFAIGDNVLSYRKQIHY